jgi:hypothetical protein
VFRRAKSATALNIARQHWAGSDLYQPSVIEHVHASVARPGYWVRPPAIGSVAKPAGYYADPSGQHQQRWWDGGAWTVRVADGSRTTIDLR